MAPSPKARHAARVPVSPQGRVLAPAELTLHRSQSRLGLLDRTRQVTARVADVDRGLVAGVASDLQAAARAQLVARVLHQRSGDWDPLAGALPGHFDGWLGLLVLDGLLVRSVEIDGLGCCEILGPGDLLRPWDEDGHEATLHSRSAWRVVEPARVAVLDAAFARRACRWPAVVGEIVHRSLMRSRSLSVLLAATQARRADVRLRTLFWHLADRWGRVTTDGVRLELPLTHSVIAQLTGLRRPTVSLTLAKLERAGEIVRVSRAEWLIRRSTPGELAA